MEVEHAATALLPMYSGLCSTSKFPRRDKAGWAGKLPFMQENGGTSLSEISFVALDTETTGLSARYCELLEVAAVRFDGAGNVMGRYAQLIDPCCHIAPEATAVHGITNRMVAGKPTLDFVLPEFFEFLNARESIVVIHNASFDLSFLHAASRRLGNRCPAHPVVDSLQLARKRLRELHSHRLDVLVAHFSVGDGVEHRAAGDAEMLRRIFLKMIAGNPCIGTLQELQLATRFRSFGPPQVLAPRRVVVRG